MEPTEPNGEQFARIAEGITVADPTDALTVVRGTVARRRRRRHVVTGLVASAALVTGGVVAVNAVTGDDGGEKSLSIVDAPETTPAPETTVASSDVVVDPDAAAAGEVEPGEVSEPVGDTAEPVIESGATVAGAATVVEVVDARATSFAIGPGDPLGDGYVEWLVPWRDGFLAGRTSQVPQALPEALPEEIVALFPQEVVDFFDGELPPTIDEAIEMLTDAGLLDEVTAVLNEHPEASDAIYSSPTSEPVFAAYFSTDGSDWEEVPMTRPDGIGYFQSVQSTGDRLVVVSQEVVDVAEPGPFGPFGNPGAIVVASTTDLTNWDIAELPTAERPSGLPEVIGFDVFPQTLAVNGNGWVVGVVSHTSLDVEALLPPDVRDELRTPGGGGFGVEYQQAGVVVTIQGPYIDVLNAEGDVVGGEPQSSQEYSFTWDELGVPDDAVELVNQGGTNQQWAASWGEPPVAANGAAPFWMVASTDGFYGRSNTLDYSPDGLMWTEIDLPSDAFGITTLLPIDGGVIAVVNTADGGTDIYRVSGSAGTFEPLDVPGLPDHLNDSFGNPSPSSALLVDATPPPVQVPTSVTIESDGFASTIAEDGPIVSVTLVDPSGAVVLDQVGNLNDQNPDILEWTSEDLRVIDPDSGDVLLSIDSAVAEAAYSAQIEDRFEGAFVDEPYRPDLWLIATIDGDRWLVEDLVDDPNEAYFGQNTIAVNGDVVLINTGTEWTTYDLT